MQVVFRTDASLQIGTGHVMRCLTLAAALREQGAICRFLCREHPGNLIDEIRQQEFDVSVFEAGQPEFQPHASPGSALPQHASWLGVEWQDDATATTAALHAGSPDWLVIDHYAIGRSWELQLRPHCKRLMVVDDLADRAHDCDLLLDQTLDRVASDYAALVPDPCTVLAGTHFALLRPEFAALRDQSLRRRESPQLRRLLVSMGGVDRSDATSQVLEGLLESALPPQCRVTVMMGPHAPWLQKVQALAGTLPWACEVAVNVADVAQRMADSDLAIGAAGGTAWERCTLGLPTIVVVLARNQQSVAHALQAARAVIVVDGAQSLAESLPGLLGTIDSDVLQRLSAAASMLCDGQGARRAVAAMTATGCTVRPMREDDLVAVLQWRNHPDVRRFMYTQHQISLAEHRAWYDRVARDRHRHLLIVEEAHGPLGFVQFTEKGDGMVEWGFYAAPEASPGSGRKLGAAALNHAFSRLGFERIHGEALAFNERSIAFHRKLGFQDEGVLKDHHFDGERYHDVHRFVLHASQWHAPP